MISRLKSLITPLTRSALSLFFPQLCLHCHQPLPEGIHLLCPTCFQELELLNPTNRCPGCFCLCASSRCAHCPATKHHGAAFCHDGVAKSVLTSFKYGDRPELAKSLSGFLLLQFSALQWPIPDLITFIPQSFLRAYSRGYNQSALLAEELAKLTGWQLADLLKKTHFSLSQTQQDLEARLLLDKEAFCRRTNLSLQNKTILLIDDVYTTGATIKAASAILKEQGAHSIYSLTVTQAEL